MITRPEIMEGIRRHIQRIGGQGDILLSAPQDIAGHGDASSCYSTLFYMKSRCS